jgi:hypothetical protein
MKDKHYSEGVLKELVWLSGVIDSFAEAEEVMARVGHLPISDSSIWRRKERWGEQFKGIEEKEREKANTPSRSKAFRAQVLGSAQRMGVSMDGTKVHIRDEGWKELKVGCSFEIEVRPTWNKESSELQDLAHAIENQYVAYLGGPKTFGEMMWAAAQQRGWESAVDRQVIGDAAPWIWNLAVDYFYDAQQVVDWFHPTEHLADIGKWIHGEETPAAKKWRKEVEKQLYQGHAQQIANDLRTLAQTYPNLATDLEREAGYFETNKRRMQYLEFREDGFVIGSGMVESGCKQYKARFCGPGMRWGRDGIGRLIPIRSAVMSGSFDSMWASAYNSPQN